MSATEEEIRRAKEYLTLRLKAERLAVSTMNDALLSAARRIVDISRKYNIPPDKFRFSANPLLKKEINDILALLREALYSYVENAVAFEDEDGGTPYIAPALTEEDHGKTFRQRLAEYVGRWGYETEAVIAATGLGGVKDRTAVIDGIREYLDRPYDNPWVKDHRGEGDAVRLRAAPHYGRGKRIAATSALTLLLTTVIAKGWMQNWERRNAGKRGYYVFRGSSYPCDICNSQTGFLHDITDKDGLPPYHPHCCCYIVYTDNV